MFQLTAANVRERECHDLMRVFHFTKEEMKQLEKQYKNEPPEALTLVVLHQWREKKGRKASGDELMRYLKLIEMPVIASKVFALKIHAQTHRL